MKITVRDTLRIAKECGLDVSSDARLKALHRIHRFLAASDEFGYKGSDIEAMQACLDLSDRLDQMSLHDMEELDNWLTESLKSRNQKAQ